MEPEDPILTQIWVDFTTQYFKIINVFYTEPGHNSLSILISMRRSIISSYLNCKPKRLNSLIMYNQIDQNLSNENYQTVIQLIDQAFIKLLDNKFPATQFNLDQSVVEKWPKATDLLIQKLNDYKPLKFMKFKEFFEKLKSFDGTDSYSWLVDLIKNYKKIHDIWLPSQGGKFNIETYCRIPDKRWPFCAAIAQGFREEVLNAFIESGWDLNEFCCADGKITCPLRLAFDLHKFKLLQAMIIKSNENVIERKYMLGFFDSRHFQTDQINTIIPLPFKYVPPFKTFDDRLDFVHYIHFAIDKIPGQKPDVFDLSTRGVLTWYKKYQAAIFAAIVCKADHLPRLNKDVIFAISEFIS